jgi:hypothetical protein
VVIGDATYNGVMGFVVMSSLSPIHKTGGEEIKGWVSKEGFLFFSA